MLSICEHFARELTAGGWTAEPKGSGTAFRRDRSMIVIAVRDAGAIWTVFPTPPKLPTGVVTKPHPVPLATFTFEGDAAAIQVFAHVVDRNGLLTKKPFFAGDARAVFATLLAESSKAVDDFVRNVERPNE